MERKPPCSRAVKAPLSRQKANLPSGSFIALGSRSQAADSTHTLGLKREGTSLSVGMAKKLKTKDIDTPTTSGAPSQRNSSSLSQTWSSGFSISSSLEAMETLKKGDCSTEFVEKLLCAIASQLRERSSFHPEPMLSALLCICAKCYPDLFRKATVLEAFCELLRSCSVSKGSFQAHSNLRCLICSIMMETWKEQREWPEIFAKAYVDDAMSERSWVDRQESRPFVKAILTSFGTLLPSDAAWNALLLHEEETFGHEATDLASIVSSSDTSHGNGCTLPNRFLYRIEQVQLYITEVLHEWWMRRADTIPKKVFLTIAACTGFFEVRLSASQRMDNWLQNSRAPWAVAWLLIAIWRNSSEFDQHDQEVIGHLCRIRLKSKAFTRVFSLAVKESFLTNTSKATALLSFALRNELSSNRASSHVNIIGVCFQTYEVLSTQVLACVMIEYLFTKDDCLRVMKALFREVVRGVLKNEFPLPVFCQWFFDGASKAFKPESPLKERIYRCLEDMIGIAVFLRIPSSREGYATSRKDTSLWDPVHQDIRKALHEVVVWLKNSVFRTFRLSKEDYIRSYHRLLFLDRPECYIGKDGWPTESEKNLLLRTVAESGVLEKTLLELVTVNQFGDLPFNLAVGIELVDQLVRRAYFNPFNGKVNIEVTKDLVGALLKACIYRRPEGIVLPPRYSPVPMAISSLYWMTWIDLVILSSTNPQTVGAALWKSYPTGHYLMEMVIVEQFTFPPFTLVSGEQTAASFWNIEEEAVETERREILELEVYLAAASTKQVITEENSLLLPQLMKYDPKGLARCPPTTVIDQMCLLSKQLGLRYKFCASRSPDFLLDIIDRQGALQSLPWLSDIIKQNDDPFNLLPIECCCEFLINHPEAMLDDAEAGEVSFSASTALPMGVQNGFGSGQIQYRDRLRQMASSVIELLWESKENCTQAKSAIFYFLNRLHADSYVDRTLVLLLLEKVLHRDVGASKPFENLGNVTPDLLEQFQWLVVSLPEIPYFSQIKERVIEILLKCCEFETDPRRLHAYIHYLYLHLGDATLETCCKSLAKGLSRRRQTLIRLIPYGVSDDDVLVEKTHNILLDMFAQYLRSTLHAPVEDEETVKDSELQIRFHNDQSSITTADVFHFMVYLLVRQPSVEGYANYKFIFSLLLGENESKAPKFCHGANGQPVELLSSQSLSIFMLSNNEALVDRVLIGLKASEVHQCLRQFGLPINNANKLLGKLDDFVATQGSTDDPMLSRLRQFVLFYRSNGALGGDAFLRSFGSPAEPSGATMNDRLTTSSEAMDVHDSSLEESRFNICIPALLNELFVGKRDGVVPNVRGQFYELLVRLVNEMLTEGKKPLCHCCIDWLLNWQPSVKRKVSAALLRNRSQITSLFCLLSKLKDKTLREAFAGIISRLAATNPAMGTWFASFLKRIQSELHLKDEAEESLPVFSISAVPFSSSTIGKVVSWRNPELLHLSAEEVAMTAFSKNQTAETHIVLTMIPHVTKLFTITSIISALLSKFSVELECSKVLDFIMSSTRNPRVLKGRDSRPARFDPGDRLLSLSVDQLLVLTQYTIAEFCSKLSLANACTFKSNPQPAIEWSIGVAESDDQYEKIYEQSAYFDTRMSMLLHYCETDEHLFRLISWLEDSTENLTEKDIRQIMLLEIYFKCPRVLCNFRAFDVSSKINCLINCRSNKLDLILHSMICRWAHLAKLPGKESSVSQIGSVLKRAARDHPCLMIRHLPLLASHLRGTTDFRTTQYCNSTYLLWFTIILALLENLAPHSFKPYYVSSTMDILNSFIAFARNYVVRFPRLIAFVDKVFVILKAFYAVNPELTISFMKSNASVLQVISNRYPELHSMRSLLSLMSLCTFPMAGRRTCSPLPDGGNDSSDDQWTPLLVRPPSPIYPGQVTQILNRLARASQNPEIIAALKEIEDLCQMKPDGLPYFKDKLVSLLTNENADIRKTALCLIINCLNENPSEIDTVVPMLQHCLNHPELSVAQTIADRLPDICRLCSAKNASLLIRSACLRVNTLQNIEQNLISSISAVNTHCLTGFLSN